MATRASASRKGTIFASRSWKKRCDESFHARPSQKPAHPCADVPMNPWVRVCATSELLPGEHKVAWDGDTPIVVFNYDGDFYALEDRCSHEDFELSAGLFDADEATVECALHGAK